MRHSLLVGLGLLAGCAGGQAPVSVLSIRDSAGIQIVEHPAGYEDGLPVWTLGEPVLDLGGSDAPGHDLFRVGGAARLRNGRIVVINRSTAELRFFDSTGAFLSALGRRGNGPGEFSNSISAVQVLSGDTLFVIDGTARRGTTLSPSGAAQTISFATPDRDHYLSVSARLGDGRLIAQYRGPLPMEDFDGPIRRDTFPIVLFRPGDPRLDTLALVPGGEVFPARHSEGGQEYPTIRGVEFGKSTHFVAGGDRILLGTNEAGEIREYDGSGRLVRLIRSATPPEPVTEEYRASRIKERLDRIGRARADEAIKAEWRKNEESPRFAAVFPWHERIMLGTDGSIWLERQRRFDDEGHRFLVFDSAGRAIATLRCPDRMRPYSVGAEEVIGLWRDSDEVEHVRVYPVRRQ